MTDSTADASFGEIRDLLTALPGPSDAAAVARGHAAGDALELMDGLLIWLATWQGRTEPRLDRPRAVVFVGRDDDAAGAENSGGEAARAMIAAYRDGHAAAARLSRLYDAELRVHELAVESPSAGDGDGAVLTESACATAMAYGMMAVEDELDLLCLTATGPGVEGAAAALCRTLYGEAVDPLQALRRHGGHAIAAVAGSILAARMGRVPVLLDGFAAAAAAAVLHRLDEDALDHCLAGHVAAGSAHRGLLDRIGKEPLLDLGLTREDGRGALLALGVLRGVIACREAAPEADRGDA